MEGALILPHKDLKTKLNKRRICLKYSNLRCKNCRNLNYILTKGCFYIMVFNEKICRIKTFDAYPTLKTCDVFLDDRQHSINSKTLSIFSAVNDANTSADELRICKICLNGSIDAKCHLILTEEEIFSRKLNK